MEKLFVPLLEIRIIIKYDLYFDTYIMIFLNLVFNNGNAAEIFPIYLELRQCLP